YTASKGIFLRPSSLKMLERPLTSIPALFASMGAKISSFETLRGFRPRKSKQIRGSSLPRICF
ncbi:MAG: hypothetical protein J5586_01610, partial [Clostridia bacterium]|nr:hypothetical protein [Clostridia bacterium]